MRFRYCLQTFALAAIFSLGAAGAPALPVRPTTDPTIVELKANGEAVLAGMKPLADAAEIKKIMVRERDRQERAAKLNGVPASPAIIIRADRDCAYTRLIELMDLAKSAGFVNVSLEAAGRNK